MPNLARKELEPPPRRPEAQEVIWSTLAGQPFFGVYLLQDGRFLYVNERFAQILGYTVDEVMRLPSVLDTVYEADRQMVRENIRTRLDGEVEQIRYSLRGRRKDGSPVELEVQGRRVMHEGRPAIVGVQSDVSELAREERTYHAKQRAEALGAMAAGVAHDFRNILAVISTTGEMMAPHIEGAVADDLEEIRKAAQRGKILCQQLMTFGAGPNEGGVSASLTDVLSGVTPIIERLLAPRRIRVSKTLGADLRTVRVSPARLEQVVMNLVLNAADATAENGEVELSAALAGSSDEPHVVLKVRDRGVGIAPEHLDRIFEPYFTTKGDKGNGLGLRNVWQIVTGAGGSVEVDSTVGEGSTFSVFLPVEGK
jgi:two-component system cell cycle sensor histidine kinase/response regulator CckA